MTDEELKGALPDIPSALEIITTLRAQLAVAEACNRGLVRLNEATQARADRAEASLAAQIEVDAGTLDDVADNWSCGHMPPHCHCARDKEQWRFAADEIRNQPHDRTALDRYREKALREAAQVLTDETDLARIAMPQAVPILAADRKAILAMIEAKP